MSVELLDVVLLVEDGAHAVVALLDGGVLVLVAPLVVVPRDVALAPQVEGEVDHALLGVQVFLLKYDTFGSSKILTQNSSNS